MNQELKTLSSFRLSQAILDRQITISGQSFSLLKKDNGAMVHRYLIKSSPTMLDHVCVAPLAHLITSTTANQTKISIFQPSAFELSLSSNDLLELVGLPQ